MKDSQLISKIYSINNAFNELCGPASDFDPLKNKKELIKSNLLLTYYNTFITTMREKNRITQNIKQEPKLKPQLNTKQSNKNTNIKLVMA